MKRALLTLATLATTSFGVFAAPPAPSRAATVAAPFLTVTTLECTYETGGEGSIYGPLKGKKFPLNLEELVTEGVNYKQKAPKQYHDERLTINRVTGEFSQYQSSQTYTGTCEAKTEKVKF